MSKAVQEMGKAETFRGYGPNKDMISCVRLLLMAITNHWV